LKFCWKTRNMNKVFPFPGNINGDLDKLADSNNIDLKVWVKIQARVRGNYVRKLAKVRGNVAAMIESVESTEATFRGYLMLLAYGTFLAFFIAMLSTQRTTEDSFEMAQTLQSWLENVVATSGGAFCPELREFYRMGGTEFCRDPTSHNGAP